MSLGSWGVPFQVRLWGGDTLYLWDEPVRAGVSRRRVQVPKARGGPAAAERGGCKALRGLHGAGGFLLGPQTGYLPCSALQSQVRALGHPEASSDGFGCSHISWQCQIVSKHLVSLLSVSTSHPCTKTYTSPEHKMTRKMCLQHYPNSTV